MFDKFNKEKSISFLVEYNAINQKKKLDLIVEERQDPIEDIKMGGILEELLLLLFRLELDRRRTEHLLNIEKANFTKLKSQIENISYKRAVGNYILHFILMLIMGCLLMKKKNYISPDHQILIIIYLLKITRFA